jgi:hypothetical protein
MATSVSAVSRVRVRLRVSAEVVRAGPATVQSAAVLSAPVRGVRMLHEGQLVYGLVVAVDVEGFSRRGILDQAAVLVRLKEVLDRAAARTGLVRADWLRQPRGDGELAVLPAGSDVSRVVADFSHEVAEELKRGSGPRLRLRIAMHHGALTTSVFGPIGDALVVACRLLDAESTREALARHPAEDVVVVVSQRLYEDVVATRFRGLRPDRFRPVTERVKGRTYCGYVCVGSPKPGEPAPDGPALAAVPSGPALRVAGIAVADPRSGVE